MAARRSAHHAPGTDLGKLKLTLGGIEIFSGGVFQLNPDKEKALVAHLKGAELYASAAPKDGVFSAGDSLLGAIASRISRTEDASESARLLVAGVAGAAGAAAAVADGPQSVIRDQVTNGVAVRMAVLDALSRNLPGGGNA